VEYRLAAEIRASLPGGAVYRYFKDRYALQLLAYAAVEGRSLREMRRGRFGPLLQKPAVRRIVGSSPQGVTWAFLDSCFPLPTEDYELTFGTWGSVRDWRWNQTSRPGFNLVVQVNFPAAHDRAYRRYIAPRGKHPFVRLGHPVNRKGLHTLAWSRLDVDLDRGEALIEEVQSDWIREAEDAAEDALLTLIDGGYAAPEWLSNTGCDATALFRYVEHVLSRHRRIWDEATLGASLWVLRERLGIRKIFMHTYEGGCALKRMDCWPPPRSLYEDLPRSFCFERVGGAPSFLRDQPRASRHEFWRLRL
jgi:hypothetical protein